MHRKAFSYPSRYGTIYLLGFENSFWLLPVLATALDRAVYIASIRNSTRPLFRPSSAAERIRKQILSSRTNRVDIRLVHRGGKVDCPECGATCAGNSKAASVWDRTGRWQADFCHRATLLGGESRDHGWGRWSGRRETLRPRRGPDQMFCARIFAVSLLNARC